MKKVRHYRGDCFQFHKDVLENKKKGKTKDVITKMELSLKDSFSMYSNLFNTDNLQSLYPLKVFDFQRTALKDMYSYRAKMFQKLKTSLTTDENGRQSVLCPNCTINNVESLDHLLPQTEFPEFSDNPLNLIGCCSTCNAKKNDIWRKNGDRIFLNLYLDDLPNVQYLFVKFDTSCLPPNVTYEVRNDNKISTSLYSKIAGHYEKLDLCRRFKENSDDLFGDISSDITSNKKYMTKENIKKTIIEKAQDWQRRYGYNFWKAIFYIECCNDEVVFNYLYSR